MNLLRNTTQVLTFFCVSLVFTLFSTTMSLAQIPYIDKECLNIIEELGREGAVSYWTGPANKDDAKAQYCLGISIGYFSECWPGIEPICNEQTLKKHREIDVPDAVEWIRRSAEQGLAPAQRTLGFYFAKGLNGLNQDSEKARYLMEKAANQGDTEGNIQLGEWYRKGDVGLPVDNIKAYQHIRLGIELYRVQLEPTVFNILIGFGGFEREIKDLARDLTDEERIEADTWVESQLKKFTTN